MWDFETSVTIGLMAISGTLALSCLYIMGWLIKHRDRYFINNIIQQSFRLDDTEMPS